eukprot:4902842-Pleurochrysis_carterae.AAC.5
MIQPAQRKEQRRVRPLRVQELRSGCAKLAHCGRYCRGCLKKVIMAVGIHKHGKGAVSGQRALRAVRIWRKHMLAEEHGGVANARSSIR